MGAAALASCSNDEPKRFRVHGSAKFDGQPIPYGDVLFTPDGSKKNSGPQGIAHIRDGKYDTSASEGKGFGGGPTVVRITGFSGPGGKLLCEVEMQVDLPKGDTPHDIDVPKKDAKSSPKTEI
jgi:hypothetical protein